MKQIVFLLFTAFLALSPLTAAKVLFLQTDSPGYFLSGDKTPTVRLEPGESVQSDLFPLSGNVLELSGRISAETITPGRDPWQVGAIQIFYFQDGKECGHEDFYLSGDAGEHINLPVKQFYPRSSVNQFAVRVANYGVGGTLTLEQLTLGETVDAPELCTDPGFERTLGMDHFFPLFSGTDWDALPYFTDDGRVELRENSPVDGGNMLFIENCGAVSTPRFSYSGEELRLGFWYRQQRVTPGDKPWAYAGAQLVYFDAAGKTVGHCDLTPLNSGDSGWQYYHKNIPAGSLNRGIASFAVLFRIFSGATGEIQVDRFHCLARPSGEQIVYDETSAVVAIDPTCPEARRMQPIWNGVDLSYATQIDEPVVRTALRRLRAAGIQHLRLREFLQGTGLVKHKNDDGTFVLDFSTVDRITDFAVNELGFLLTPTLESTPAQLAVAPDQAYCNRYPPRDPAEWGKLVELLVLHWMERYGADVVCQWRFECWNEPAAPAFFKGSAEEFADIYSAYLQAMLAVERQTGVTLQIGTMSAISNSPYFTTIFNREKANGTLKNIDFFSMHLYGGLVGSFHSVERALNGFSVLLEPFPELQNRPLYITEYNGDTMNNPHLDTNVAAAFNTKMLRLALDHNIAQLYFFSVIDFLYGSDDRPYVGGLGMFNRLGQPKAVFHTLSLFARLETGRRIPFRSSNEPFDGLAVLHDDGEVNVLLTSFAEASPDGSAEKEIVLELVWPGEIPPAQITWEFIDSEHGNPVRAIQAPSFHPEEFSRPGLRQIPFQMESRMLRICLPIQLNSTGLLTITPDRQ